MIVAAFVLLLGACGGTATETTDTGAPDAANDQSQQDSTGTSGTTDDTTTTTSGSAVDAGDDGELTLADFIPGAVQFDENTDWRAQEMEVQQQVAECMAAEGFEYIPFVPSDVGGGFVGDAFDEEEYVKTYGFGVSTWVLQDQAFQEGEGEDPYASDPNQEIVNAMDEVEQEEYYRVLYGGEPDIITNTPQEELDAMTEDELNQFYNDAYSNWQSDGCQNTASEDVYGGGGAQEEFWQEFGQDFEDVMTRVESDPRMVDAQTGWSACMADHGYDYASQQDMYAYFYGDENGPGEFQQRVDAVVTWPEPVFDEGGGSVVEGEGSSSSGVATTIGAVDVGGGDGSYAGPEYDMEELQPLIDEEIGVATADYECSQPLRDLQENIYTEYQQIFIDENLDRLVAFRDANG